MRNTRYREALGKGTGIGVTEVPAGSAVEQAGLLAGDEVKACDGKRVFNMGELLHRKAA